MPERFATGEAGPPEEGAIGRARLLLMNGGDHSQFTTLPIEP